MSERPTYEELEQRIRELEKFESDRKMADELLIQKIQAAVVVHDNNTKIIASNAKAQELLGLTEDQMLGMTAIDPEWKFFDVDGKILPPDEYPVNQVLSEGLPLRNFAAGIYRPNKGDQVWVIVNGEPVRDHMGNVRQAVMTFMDITELKQSEDALRESEKRFRALFEDVPAAIQGYNSDGIIHYWNKESEKIYGYKKNEAVGKNLVDLIIPPEMRDLVREAIKKGAKTEKMPPPEELLLMRKDGSRVPVFSNHICLKMGEKASEFYCLDINMTEQMRLRNQLQQVHKMEALGTLTGGIAHDFNNLLYIISGNTELAMEDIPAWNPVHHNLKEINNAGLKAAGIVKQLLNFSQRADHGLKPIGAVTVIKDALEFLRSTIPSSIEIRQHFPKADTAIIGNPTQINQMLMSLCINSSQAMETTGGVLDIAVDNITLDESAVARYSDLAPGDYLKITVVDTGPGIEPQNISRIFDPYFTTKDIGAGSGMGLAVAHGIVKSHNGDIAVDSQPGEGAAFTVLFPAISETPVIDSSESDKIPRGHGEAILFVDDNAAIAQMGGQILERLGYSVKPQTSPAAALELFRSQPHTFDLVITDMTMPQMTGIQLSEKLNEIHPDIPVVICTGHSPLIDKEKAKLLGIAGYVMKPIVMRDIAKTVRKVLDEAGR